MTAHATARLPTGAGSIDAILYEKEAQCPRCGRAAAWLFFYTRLVDHERVVVHCGCLTPAERENGTAPQQFKNEIDRRAWEKRVRQRVKDLTS